jgi:hypothetical protein
MIVSRLKRTREAIRHSVSDRARSGVLYVLGASILAVSSSARTAQANTIYNLNSFPTLQNGYSVTGTITTDGCLGRLAYSDIIATSITSVTNGVSTYHNLNPDHVYGSTQLFATSTGLFLPAIPPDPPSPNFSMSSTGYDTVELQYDYTAGYGMVSVGYFGSVHQPTTTSLWRTSSNKALNLTGQPWLIAQTVPEPSGPLLLAIGVATLSGMRRLRNVNARKRDAP